MRAMQTRREGFALIIVILGILILSGVTLTALRMGADEASAARATRISSSALYAADAGVRATQISFPSAANSLNSGDSLVDADWTTISNGSSYRRTIHRRDAGAGTRVYSLTVEGKTSGPLGGEATVQVWLTSSPARFMGAINSKTKVTISSSGYTDSYDSRLGVYGGTNVYSTSAIYANGAVTLSGSAKVYGSISAGSTIDYDPVDNLVTGSITTGAPPISYPQETCPAGGFSAFPAQVSVSYSQSTGKLSTGDSVVVAPGTYYFYEVTLSGGAQMIIPSGGKVTMYIGSKFTTSGGGGINNRGKNAADVSLISCGPTTQQWSLSGGSDAYFTVYAPNNKVALTGGSPVWGAIVAGEFVSSGGAPVHYDVALRDNGSRASLVSRSWFQMLR